ncbi:13397_t:CDS:2 [Entrophospora sp. SA101]|nr:13397_t:CDS:2 [Entrophospora sp. SA101]
MLTFEYWKFIVDVENYFRSVTESHRSQKRLFEIPHLSETSYVYEVFPLVEKIL